MSLSTLFKTVALIAGIVLAVQYQRNPLHTKLPFGSTDLTSVQEQLSKLPEEDRKLVESYVKRSNGDVLTPQLADPDNPLTARTFAEAIELEKQWAVKMAAAQVKADELKAQRQAKLEPLRQLVNVSLEKAEIITVNEYLERVAPGWPHESNSKPAFVADILIENLSDERILTMRGALKAHDKETTYVLPLDLCWVDLGLQREMPARSSLKITCGNRNGGVDTQQKDFVDDKSDRFEVEWIPHYIKFASGREIDSGVNW